MGKSFRQLYKEYFFFLKKDRDGIMVLIILILIAIIGHLVILKNEIGPQIKNTEWVQAFEMWENQNKNLIKSPVYFYFDPNVISVEQIDSLSIPDFVKKNIIRYREAGGKFSKASDLQKIYGMGDSIYNLIEPYLIFPDEELKEPKETTVTDIVVEDFDFDPNIVSPEDMVRLGFTRFQASNVEKYRKQGGAFSNPHDLLKIYGIDTSFYLSIAKHIRIKQNLPQHVDKGTAAIAYVELNSADSLELLGLKGIGPVFASRILKYRNLLGGFYSVSQLLEVYGFPEETYLNKIGRASCRERV